MRKAAMITKELNKARIELDRAQRAVFALNQRTDVRLGDIIAANPTNILVDDYREVLETVARLNSELRTAEGY